LFLRLNDVYRTRQILTADKTHWILVQKSILNITYEYSVLFRCLYSRRLASLNPFSMVNTSLKYHTWIKSEFKILLQQIRKSVNSLMQIHPYRHWITNDTTNRQTAMRIRWQETRLKFSIYPIIAKSLFPDQNTYWKKHTKTYKPTNSNFKCQSKRVLIKYNILCNVVML